MSGYIGNIPVPQATQTRDVFTATSGQTSFATSGYTPGFLDVWLNGVKLVNGTDFTATNGSDVVLTSGAAASDIVEVLSYSTFEVNSQTFTGSSTFTGDVLIADKLVHDGDTNTAIRFPAADTVTVETAGSERVRVDSSGNVLCGSDGGGDIGSSTKRFKDLYLSGGVYLGGTGAANYLDDYEEGTWTPAFTALDGTTLTVSNSDGKYTKIGSVVYITFRLSVTSSGAGVSSEAAISGLPFAIGRALSPATGLDAVSTSFGEASNIANVATGDIVTAAFDDGVANSIRLIKTRAGTTIDIITSDFSGDESFRFTGFYFTDA